MYQQQSGYIGTHFADGSKLLHVRFGIIVFSVWEEMYITKGVMFRDLIQPEL